MTVWRSKCGHMELRLGRWQDVLADVAECDAVVIDPPYSIETHKGNDMLPDRYSGRRDLSYPWWTARDVRCFVRAWANRCKGWIAAMTDDRLSFLWRVAMRAAGRYSFASVSITQHRPRLVGDGPGSCTVHLQASRPSQKRFLSWGSLPGWYESTPERGSAVNGAKPLALMQRIVCDYSRPGDLVVDPCAGGGTTLLAAAIEGRRAIGAEQDPKTFALAVRRLSKGYTPRLQMLERPKPKQESLL